MASEIWLCTQTSPDPTRFRQVRSFAPMTRQRFYFCNQLIRHINRHKHRVQRDVVPCHVYEHFQNCEWAACGCVSDCVADGIPSVAIARGTDT